MIKILTLVLLPTAISGSTCCNLNTKGAICHKNNFCGGCLSYYNTMSQQWYTLDPSKQTCQYQHPKGCLWSGYECREGQAVGEEKQLRITKESAVGQATYGNGETCSQKDNCAGCYSWYDDDTYSWINLLKKSGEGCGYNTVQDKCTLSGDPCRHLDALGTDVAAMYTNPPTGGYTYKYIKETNQLNQALQKEDARLLDDIEAAVGVAGSPQIPAYRAGKASKEKASAETYSIVGPSDKILYKFAGIGVLFLIYSVWTFLCEYKNRFYTENNDLEV